MRWSSFWPALVSVALVGCGGNPAGDSTPGPKSEVLGNIDMTARGGSIADAGEGSVADARSGSVAEAAPEPATGTPGSRVWLDSSVRAMVGSYSFFDTLGPDPKGPLVQHTCWAFERTALTDSQLAVWNALTLVALSPACAVDGYQYYELTVFDADGSSATYRDTGCSYLSVPGATAMLPANAFGNGVIPEQSMTTCP